MCYVSTTKSVKSLDMWRFCCTISSPLLTKLAKVSLSQIKTKLDEQNEEIDKEVGGDQNENRRNYFSMALLSKLNTKKDELNEKY